MKCLAITTLTNTSTHTCSSRRCKALGRMCCWLFRVVKGRPRELSYRPISQSDVYRMIRRGAKAFDVAATIGCHSFRGHRGFRSACATVTSFRRSSKWPTTSVRPHDWASMTGDTIKSRSMRLSGSESDQFRSASGCFCYCKMRTSDVCKARQMCLSAGRVFGGLGQAQM